MILVVDDDETQGELTRQRLVAAGLEARLQTTPFGSLAPMQRGEFDLVIMDVNMPALSGTKITELLVSGGSEHRSPVLLYSNLDERELKAAAEKCGADGWLPKSSGRALLLQRVRQLMTKRRPGPAQP